MKAPFIVVHDGKWFPTGSEIPKAAEKSVKETIEKRKQLKERFEKESLKHKQIKAEITRKLKL